MLVIVDYGLGNLGSIFNMLKRIGVECKISAVIQDIEAADRLILPGVGSFDHGIRNLQKLGIIPIMRTKVIEQATPILGICLGMQLFGRSSTEGVETGLGWIDAHAVRFFADGKKPVSNDALRVPHMGWNTITLVCPDPLFRDMHEPARFYFVHSYHVVSNDENLVIARTSYGTDFISCIRKRNIVGVQFHPEKSHKYGMALLANFCEAR